MKLGNLEPTRDLTYVKDTCLGFLEIYNSKDLFGEVTNIGMNSEISIGDLAKKIGQLLEVDLSFEIENERIRPKNSEVERLVCSNTKLLNNTSWSPKYNLKSGLIETINWFKENGDIIKSKIYNV